MKKFFLSSFIKDQSGQSLMEIIVGLAIGAILIGTASFGIAFILRSTTTNQNLSGGSQLTQGLIDNVQTFANSNWQNVYGLSKTSSNRYFLVASGTSYIAVAGQEGVASNDIINGLVGKWGFDEATGTVAYDSSGNRYDGTITFGASTERATSSCQIGYCLRMVGGSDQMTMGSYSGYDTADFSVSLWLKPMSYKTAVGGANGNIFLGRENYTVSGFRAGIDGTGSVGQLQFWTTQSGGTLTLSTGNTRLSTSSSAFYNVVVTYSSASSTGFVYVDGKQAGTTTGSYVPPSGRTLGLDASIGGVGFLDAYFDDVRWYNRALSASEVSNLYNSAVFTRYFYVENVCRTSDSSAGVSTTTSPCPGGTGDDPLTQRVTAFTNWAAGANTDQVSLARYVTRWGNFAVRQTDWSGSSGQDGPLTAPNSSYSSSSNVTGTSTFGSFQIQNLSQQ